MRSTIVPAQVTTVEDRIIGNLTFIQLLILVVSLVIGASLYMTLPPHLHFGPLKLTVSLLQFIFLGGLTIRFQGKIVADWLVLYLRFASRPRIYLFTKNDLTARRVVMQESKKEEKQAALVPEMTVALAPLSLPEQDHLGQLLKNPLVTVRFALKKKGGIDVSLTPQKL